MTATIIQISRSRGGVPKRAIAEGILTVTGIEGDSCAHPEFHGGPKQAVLLIAFESLEELKALGYPLFPGALGENLTTSGLDRRQIRVGQRFHVGEAVVEITKVRVPCATLNRYNGDGRIIQKAVYDERVKAGDPSTAVWGMAGFYASVVKPGLIRANDIITLSDPVV